MWKIKALNGELTGQSFSLSTGTNVIGRSPDCDITLPLSEISKNHVKIEIFQNQALITDLDSRNGTFVDGVKIRNTLIQSGQTITLYKTLFVLENHSLSLSADYGATETNLRPELAQSQAMQTQIHSTIEQYNDPTSEDPTSNKADIKQKAEDFLNRSVLPGVYKLPEWIGFNFSIVTLLGLVVCVSLLASYLPIVGLFKSNAVKAGKEKASILATALRNENIRLLSQGLESSISVNSASSVAGVAKAYIISNDGRIIAPSIESGQKPKESFVATALNSPRELTKELNSGQVAASVPIKFYNPNTQQNFTKAYAIVIFDSNSLNSSYSLIFAKAIQSLVVSFLFLGLISLFLIKLIEFPIESLNKKFAHALRERLTNVDFKHDIVSLNNLSSNINSALNRIENPNQMESTNTDYNRSLEAQNIVQMIGFPAMAVDAQSLNVQTVNPEFEHRMGTSILYNTITEISDQAFKLSVQDLIETCRLQPEQIAANSLEFDGEDCEIQCQAIWGKKEISYFIISVLPKLSEEEEVA